MLPINLTIAILRWQQGIIEIYINTLRGINEE